MGTLQSARLNQNHLSLLIDITFLDIGPTSTTTTTEPSNMPAFTPRNIAIGAGAVVAATFLFPRSTKKVAPMENMFETQGVKNVGDRYAAQGGFNTHLPG